MTEYCRVLQGIAEYYRVLQSITGYYRVLQSTTEYYRVSQKKVYNKLDRARKKHLVSRYLCRDQPGRSKAGEEKNLQESVRNLFCVPP